MRGPSVVTRLIPGPGSVVDARLDGRVQTAPPFPKESPRTVPRVYVDPSAVSLEASRMRSEDPQAAPGAADAIRHLAESDYSVVLLADRPLPELGDLPTGVEVVTTMPAQVTHDVWFVTADPEGPWGRPKGARTILVGPRRAPGRIPLPRFDVEARDLPSAVMEILTRQAMT